MSEDTFRNNHGVWPFRREDGQWSLDLAGPNSTAHDEGVYQVIGDTLYWGWNIPNVSVTQLTWSVDGDGDLHFTEVTESDIPGWVHDLPWSRIGDV